MGIEYFEHVALCLGLGIVLEFAVLAVRYVSDWLREFADVVEP